MQTDVEQFFSRAYSRRIRDGLMKVHADRTEVHPSHALSVRNVKCILAAVPAAWLQGLHEVRLTNSLEQSSWAFFSRHDGTLTIYSRGSTPKQAVTAILSELAAVSLGITTRHRHRLSAAEAHRIQQLIDPLIEEILLTLYRSKMNAPNEAVGQVVQRRDSMAALDRNRLNPPKG